MANSVYIATSLDGYIATKRHNIDWLTRFPNPTESDYGYHEFIDKIDAIVMGRKTFDMVLSFESWPYDKPVFVLSRSLKEVPARLVDLVEIVNGDINHIVSKLNSRGFHQLYIDGGQTVQAFLRKNLVDELIISKVPIILGEGIPLFTHQEQQLHFEHCSTEVFEGGLVKSHYKKLQASPKENSRHSTRY